MGEADHVIDLLSDHEEAIGNLYMALAGIFPRQKDFWEKCGNEEFHHSRMVRTMKDLAAKGELLLTHRFNEAALNTSMQYIRDQIKRANEKQLSLKEAYAAALNIENGLLENRYFESFGGSSQEFQHVRKTLVQETMNHRNMILDARKNAG